MQKLDPYLNVDPGTMSPYQHGEVFVTDDGAETDLDLGDNEGDVEKHDVVPAPLRRHLADGLQKAVALVGKYVALHDAYLSVAEALTHGGIENRVKVNIRWVDSETGPSSPAR